MKRLIYFLLNLVLPAISFAGNSDFYYDKDSLSAEFSQLDRVSAYIDETNISYTELLKNPILNAKPEFSDTIANTKLKFKNVDWGSFCLGYYCFPVGIFTLFNNDWNKKDIISKKSFWAGVITSGIVSVTAILTLILILENSGSNCG